MYKPSDKGSRFEAEPKSKDLRFIPVIPIPPNLPTGALAISDMANAFGVTHRTLHFYEEKKLLSAERAGAMRIYPPTQVRQMALVNLCREIGMPIAQIQELLADLATARSQDDADQMLHRALVERRSELAANQTLIRRQMQQIAEILTLGDQAQGHDGANGNSVKIPFLTDFENRCLILMAEGYTPIRIGHATERPVDEILLTESSIIRKFGSSNRFQAVAKAVLLGLIGE